MRQSNTPVNQPKQKPETKQNEDVQTMRFITLDERSLIECPSQPKQEPKKVEEPCVQTATLARSIGTVLYQGSCRKSVKKAGDIHVVHKFALAVESCRRSLGDWMYTVRGRERNRVRTRLSPAR